MRLASHPQQELRLPSRGFQASACMCSPARKELTLTKETTRQVKRNPSTGYQIQKLETRQKAKHQLELGLQARVCPIEEDKSPSQGV
jgi:hypothetical protein